MLRSNITNCDELLSTVYTECCVEYCHGFTNGLHGWPTSCTLILGRGVLWRFLLIASAEKTCAPSKFANDTVFGWVDLEKLPLFQGSRCPSCKPFAGCLLVCLFGVGVKGFWTCSREGNCVKTSLACAKDAYHFCLDLCFAMTQWSDGPVYQSRAELPVVCKGWATPDQQQGFCDWKKHDMRYCTGKDSQGQAFFRWYFTDSLCDGRCPADLSTCL